MVYFIGPGTVVVTALVKTMVDVEYLVYTPEEPYPVEVYVIGQTVAISHRQLQHSQRCFQPVAGRMSSKLAT